MAAARENIDVTAPMNGTSKDRNSTTSARNPKPTTTSRKIGSASASTVVKSAVIAAVPPTRIVAPVACSSAGLTSSRKVVSNSLVAASWGAVDGKTAITWIGFAASCGAAWAILAITGRVSGLGLVPATPGVSLSVVTICP